MAHPPCLTFDFSRPKQHPLHSSMYPTLTHTHTRNITAHPSLSVFYVYPTLPIMYDKSRHAHPPLNLLRLEKASKNLVLYLYSRHKLLELHKVIYLTQYSCQTHQVVRNKSKSKICYYAGLSIQEFRYKMTHT